jgi:hypothetical protein
MPPATKEDTVSEVHENVLKVLKFSPKPMAVHEMRPHPLLMQLNGGDGVSENALCTRFSDPELKGKIWGAQRPGKRFWEWHDRPFTEEHKRKVAERDGVLALI